MLVCRVIAILICFYTIKVRNGLEKALKIHLLVAYMSVNGGGGAQPLSANKFLILTKREKDAECSRRKTMYFGGLKVREALIKKTISCGNIRLSQKNRF